MWKKIANFLVIGLLAYCLVVIFSQNDKRSNRVRLNNNGLSTNALVFPTKSKTTVKSALKKVENSMQDDDQFQLQFIAPNKVIYVFSKGMAMNLPLTQGRRFALEDFNADVPFALVGRDVKTNVYLTELQNYYLLDGHYISAIGFTGSSQTDQLNKKVFVSVNSRSMPLDLKLNQVKVVGDGPKVIEHPKHFKKIFKAQGEKKFLPSEIPIIGSGWLKHSWVFILLDLLVIMMMIVAVAYQFEIDSKSEKKHADLLTVLLDLVLVTFILVVGLKTQYIINDYFLAFVLYLAMVLSVGLGDYLSKYKMLTE
ncbi:hypothetical protein [Xylocopilactobacillus apicola]|uniref:MacB-like periplasmic core domain-containing protein n=1 Tax=Xylocopilactobacillus apicola TaxID=2932184 RepID=A0AAU9DSU4_9LACO|nr:hypothetical protein [Xylocopilactobacillus apicola]BDR58373.1 hypothetical protein XA3_08140 [Xylocopilactobacillus apicola]